MKNASKITALVFAFAAFAVPAHAAWISGRDVTTHHYSGYADSRIIHAKPKTVVVVEEPLLAAVPMAAPEEDTSSDNVGFTITTVDTNGYDTHASAAAEYVYHTQGDPASYKGEPYANFRGYQGDGGYSNNFGGYNNYYGYNGGFSY